MSKTVRATGIAWFLEKDWPRIRTLMTDSHKLPDTYPDWLRRAEMGEQQLLRSGLTVERVIIDPDEFSRWCKEHGVPPESAARIAYASDAVARKYGAR